FTGFSASLFPAYEPLMQQLKMHLLNRLTHTEILSMHEVTYKSAKHKTAAGFALYQRATSYLDRVKAGEGRAVVTDEQGGPSEDQMIVVAMLDAYEVERDEVY